MTVTQPTKTEPMMTSVMWPTTKTKKVPLTIYNAPSVRIQETPYSPRPKPQGRERAPIPVHKISPIEQQPANLIPKTTASATPAILPVMSTPSRDPTPWPNTVPASSNLFITRPWPLCPDNGDSQIQTTQKMIKSEPSQTENTQRKTTIPHPVSLITENHAATSNPATANIMATPKSREGRWGPYCQYRAQSTSHPEQNWSEEDWDGEKARQKKCKKKMKT